MTLLKDQKQILPGSPVPVEVIAEEGVVLPEYATEGAAGMDVRAYLDEPLILHPSDVALIPTGLKFSIPEGFEIQVRPRSGLALRSQIIPLNSPGTIDSDYRGECKIILINHGKTPFTIEPNMRVAQLVLAPYCVTNWQQVDEMTETRRGENGFGGTGLR